MAKKKKSKRTVEESINRELAVEQGFYDGRYKPKVIPDKKKEDKKRKCRKSNKHSDDEYKGN
jgi:hypothetical protein